MNELKKNYERYDDLVKHVSEIIKDKMYLGDSGGRSKEFLTALKIDVVINCSNINLKRVEGFEYIKFDLVDKDNEDILKYFDDFFDIVEDAFSKNKRIYVHCFAGVSRSATLVISYFMKKKKLRWKKAVKFVRKRRSIIHPNPGFLLQLASYDVSLRKKSKK